MFTNVAQDIAALVDQPEELIRVLSQLANCASTLDHYGGLQVEYDGYHHSTNTVETYQGMNDGDVSAGEWDQPANFPKAGGVFVNPAAIAFRENNRFVIEWATINVNGVWLQRPSPAQAADDIKVTLLTPGDLVVNNLIVAGNILNAQGQWQVIGNVILWVADNNVGGNLVSIGDQTVTLTDNAGTAPRVAGCYDPYAVDLYSVATNLHTYADLIDLRNDFTVAIRLRIKYQAIRTENFWSYRETNPPSAVAGIKLTGEWALDAGTPKLRFTASTTPTDISPTAVGVPARIGREYPDGSCLAVFFRWDQSAKTITLNVLQAGDTGGSSTNDETTWAGSYGEYILSEGSEKYLQIRGENVPQAGFYMERFAIWNYRLEDSEVIYEFTY